ncbi:MAG: hypothetical protein ABIR38_05970 [Chthoniobacterales bacterium]
MIARTQYIVGQLTAPLSQLIDFVQTAQGARLSLKRMQEIYVHKEEEDRSLYNPVEHSTGVGHRPGRSQLPLSWSRATASLVRSESGDAGREGDCHRKP